VAVYSNLQIRAAIAEDHIVCVPLEPKHISHASLDVTLGEYYYRTDKNSGKTIYNPFDKKDVADYFDGPHRAISHKEWATKNGVAMLNNIPKDHLVIALAPGERILGHTHEFFGIKPPGAYEIKSRSSWGRNGLAVCFDAGWVDPGYINRLTLEIYNLNQHRMMILPIGERIAQAIFYETGEVDGNYGKGRHRGFSGKYQTGTELPTLIKNWQPSLMLPKAYLDKRTKPAKIKGLRKV